MLDVAPSDPQADDLALLRRMLSLVRERRGLDFGSYRVATMLRRVRNRMIAANVRTLPEYLRRLESDPAEADALLERLTIKVSRFFRDPAVFAALREFLPRRRAERAGQPLRLWSAGCGQGEEPYSLAILLAEQGPLAAADRVLATDIDPGALAFAERGAYPAAALEDVPEPLRAYYFEPEQAPAREPRWMAGAALRDHVDFRGHDLASDAPAPDGGGFDLVCCRNVLIYLQPPLQERVEQRLARSLSKGGLLCLGEAEWLLPAVAARFDVIDRKSRLFRLREEPVA
jgi:chemotaxis methyl-accepting protein methylase